MLKIFCWLFFDAFQRTFISDKKLKRLRTKLKCSKVLFEIMSFYPKPGADPGGDASPPPAIFNNALDE